MSDKQVFNPYKKPNTQPIRGNNYIDDIKDYPKPLLGCGNSIKQETPADIIKLIIGFIYIIRCDETQYIYIGSTQDINGRWKQHQSGKSGCRSSELFKVGSCRIQIYKTFYDITRTKLYEIENNIIKANTGYVVNKPIGAVIFSTEFKGQLTAYKNANFTDPNNDINNIYISVERIYIMMDVKHIQLKLNIVEEWGELTEDISDIIGAIYHIKTIMGMEYIELNNGSILYANGVYDGVDIRKERIRAIQTKRNIPEIIHNITTA